MTFTFEYTPYRTRMSLLPASISNAGGANGSFVISINAIQGLTAAPNCSLTVEQNGRSVIVNPTAAEMQSFKVDKVLLMGVLIQDARPGPVTTQLNCSGGDVLFEMHVFANGQDVTEQLLGFAPGTHLRSDRGGLSFSKTATIR